MNTKINLFWEHCFIPKVIQLKQVSKYSNQRLEKLKSDWLGNNGLH